MCLDVWREKSKEKEEMEGECLPILFKREERLDLQSNILLKSLLGFRIMSVFDGYFEFVT